MAPPIKLTLLLQDLEFGGTQRYATHLLRRLDRDLFLPELWLLRGGYDMLPAVRETGPNLFWMSRFDRHVGPLPLFNLWRHLGERRPDILYTLTAVPCIWGRLLGRAAGVPTIVSGYRNIRPKQKERWLGRISRRTICNAQALKEWVVDHYRLPPGRVAVVPNGVDTEFFQPHPEDKAEFPLVVSLGRLVDYKHPERLIRAFSVLADRVPEARMIMCGNGPLRERVTRLIGELGLEQRIELRPGQADVRPLLNQAWVFALSSSDEGSPNVILEAMASGLPVVATSVGGVPELVNPGETGYLVENGDHRTLGENLTALLKEEGLRAEMGRKGRDKVLAEHNLDVMTRRTQEILLEAHGERPGRRV